MILGLIVLLGAYLGYVVDAPRGVRVIGRAAIPFAVGMFAANLKGVCP